MNAYKSAIKVGRGVLIAANCALYPHDHGVAPDKSIREQPRKRGDIVIGDHAWLRFRVSVLGGVRVERGCYRSGSVVTKKMCLIMPLPLVCLPVL